MAHDAKELALRCIRDICGAARLLGLVYAELECLQGALKVTGRTVGSTRSETSRMKPEKM
jgi:hypothetical protein